MKKKQHGGRRNGLSPSGPTKPRQMRLGPLAEACLASLMAETCQNASDVVRALLFHPRASEALADARDQHALGRGRSADA